VESSSILENQGEDAFNLSKNKIATVLQHHREMNFHFVSKKMESDLGIHETFQEMTTAIQTALKNDLFISPSSCET